MAEQDYFEPCEPYFLVEGAGGHIYGITMMGGALGSGRTTPGVVFRLEEPGRITVFDAFPNAVERPNYLIAAPDGSFYGTNKTSVIRMSAEADVTAIWKPTDYFDNFGHLFSFYGSSNRLVLGSDGNLYGEAVWGGTFDGGYIFKITPQGEMTPLHNFAREYVFYPRTGIAEGNDGFLYFVTKAPDVAASNTPSARHPLAATVSTSNAQGGKAFRIQVSDPLNGDQPPLAGADEVVLKKEKARVVETTIDALANDRDVDGDPLMIISTSKPRYGTVRIDGGVLRYIPDDPRKIRSDQCQYVVADGRGGTASALVTFRAPVTGRYSGRLQPVRAGSAPTGTYSLSVAASKRVSGRITIGGNTYPIKGYVGADDRIEGNFASAKGSVVHADLKVTFNPTRCLRGNVTPVRKAIRATYNLR